MKSNNLAKVEVEGSNPFARSKILVWPRLFRYSGLKKIRKEEKKYTQNF